MKRDRKFLRIGAVSKMLGIPAYVLRFWEAEFPELKPRKTDTGQRIYSEEDLEIIRRIARLRYGEKLTLSGTKQRLRAEQSEVSGEKLRISIKNLKKGLQEILADLR